MKSIFVIGDRVVDLKLVLAYYPNPADLSVTLEYQTSDNIVVAYFSNNIEYDQFVELCRIYTQEGSPIQPVPEPEPLPTKPDTKITLGVLQRILSSYLLIEDNAFENGNPLPINCDFNYVISDLDKHIVFPSMESSYYLHSPTGWTSGIVLVGNIGGYSYQLGFQSNNSVMHYRTHSPDHGWNPWTSFATDVSCTELINNKLAEFRYVDGDFEIGGDLLVDGNIIQRGSAYETHAEKLYTKNDFIVTRDGAVSALGESELTGISARKYDGENDGILAFDKDGTAYVGDVGDMHPLATRLDSESMEPDVPVVWDQALLSLKPAVMDDRPTPNSNHMVNSSGILKALFDPSITDADIAFPSYPGVCSYHILTWGNNTPPVAGSQAIVESSTSNLGDKKLVRQVAHILSETDSKGTYYRDIIIGETTSYTDWIRYVDMSLVDNEPTEGSSNLITSGGVASSLDSYLPLTGGTMTGPIKFPRSLYSDDAPLDMNNSDIKGLNQLIWNDVADSVSEGLIFPRTNGNKDSLRVYDGVVYLNTSFSDTATGYGYHLNKWTDISSSVTLTATSSSGSYTISTKKVHICGGFVHFNITVVFNYAGTAGTNPLKLKVTSPIFTLVSDLSRCYMSSYYGVHVWTNGLNVYNGESNIITFRPNSNFVVGEDATFSGVVPANFAGVS